MPLNLHTGKAVKVWNNLVHKVKAERTNENACRRHKKSNTLAVFHTVLHRGNDQSHNSRRKHDACRKGKYDVRKPVRHIFEGEANQRTDNGCTANAKRGK